LQAYRTLQERHRVMSSGIVSNAVKVASEMCGKR
jgi:hypothetical protein